jgi:carboxyl-terminal processing protease
MDVRLIGPSHTHGKPVGFFPIEDGEWYVFPVSFRTTNRNGEGNYYAGFTPNALVADGLDKDWGDPAEAGLASALRNISSGAYRSGSESVYYEPANLAAGNALLDKPMIKMMIEKK